ncbi:MAG: GntR family transcriptional regulator [Butyricicoccus sp.]|nr:GntR family transcriptional regulator [Butyricicoccus sp.]
MAYFKYEQVADTLTEMILNHTYAVGEKIPTEDELSEQFQVGRQTVRKAVALLEESGYLKKVQGSGTYVCERDSVAQPAMPTVQNPGSIALVMMNSDYIFLDIMRGASDYLLGEKYMLNSIVTDGDYEKERLALERLWRNLPAGLIFEPVCSGLLSINAPIIEKIATRIPCLLLHTDGEQRFPVLPLRDREGMKQMTDYLLSLGHRKIGTLFSFDEMTGQNRFRGFLDSLREHGIEHEPRCSVWIEHSKKEDIFQAAGSLQLDAMLRQVTAVICHDDRSAYRLIRYLESKGIRVPEDISVTGYDDSAYSVLDLPITTVVHPKTEYGKKAAQALVALIRHPKDVHLDEYTIAPQLVIRASTAPPADR